MKKSGFTLIELLTVIVIVGILASLAIPQYQKMVDKAKWAEAANTLGAIRRACLMYYNEYNEYPNMGNYVELALNGPYKGKEVKDGSVVPGGDEVVKRLMIDLPNIKTDGRFGYALYSSAYPTSCAFAFLDTNHNNMHDGVEPYLSISYQGGFYGNRGAPNF